MQKNKLRASILPLAAFLAVAGLSLAACQPNNKTENGTNVTANQPSENEVTMPTNSDSTNQNSQDSAAPSDANSNITDVNPSQVKVFKVEAKNYNFSPNEIKVKLGDRVKIELTSAEGFHDWVVDQFNAKTSRVNVGQTTSVEFVASQAGTFEFYCSVGNHRQLGMVGQLIVE